MRVQMRGNASQFLSFLGVIVLFPRFARDLGVDLGVEPPRAAVGRRAAVRREAFHSREADDAADAARPGARNHLHNRGTRRNYETRSQLNN